MGQNGWTLELEGKVNLTHYSIEPRTRKHVKGYRFLSFARNLSNKYGKKLLNIATKTGLDALKPTSKKESIKQLKITDKNEETTLVFDTNLRNVEEIVIPPEKGQEILNESR